METDIYYSIWADGVPFWSSTASNSNPNWQGAYYLKILDGNVLPQEMYIKAVKYKVLLSRQLNATDANYHKCNAFLASTQFTNPISVQLPPNNPSIATIEYNGPELNEDEYIWDFDGGEVIFGDEAGPYLVQYSDALYKQVKLEVENSTCYSPIAEAPLFKAKFFEENQSSFPSIYDGCVRWGDFNNDDFLDVILTGSGTTIIYLNDGQGSFSALNQSFSNLSNSYVSVGDFDNDHFLDFLICGQTVDLLPVTKLYKNIDGQNFNEFGTSLPQIQSGFVEWLDYNNDGKLDILLSGTDTNNQPTTQLLEGDKTGSFEFVQTTFPNVENGHAAIDDYNKDGFQDLIILGNNESGRLTKVFKNSQGVFEEIPMSLPGIFLGEATWADFDHDGMLDFVYSGNKDSLIVEISGNNLSVTTSTSFYHYKNIGLDTFALEGTDSNDFGYPHKFGLSSVDCGDYNNDGFDDILIAGMPNISWVSAGVGGVPPLYHLSMPTILENNTNGSFRTNNVDIPSFWTGDPVPVPTPPKRFECSSSRFGDYDNDGKLDILREGKQQGYTSKVYQNKTNSMNEAPQVPLNLTAIVTCDSILLSWNSSIDDHTPVTSITYEIYVGTQPNSGDLFSKKNLRKLRTTSFKLDSLSDGIYYWGVKAVDNAKTSSEYAMEQSFEVDCVTAVDDITLNYEVSTYPNPFSDELSIYINGTSKEIHYTIVNQLGATMVDNYFKKSTTISTDSWESGAYFLNLIIGNKVITKKIIHAR